MSQRFLILCFLILLSSVYSASIAPGISEPGGVMACMFCEIITDAFENESTPSGVVQFMYKRCNQMGLLEAVCEHFISMNAKKIFLLVKSGIPSVEICEKLALCDDTR